MGKIEKTLLEGIEVYELTCEGIKAKVNVEDGFNLCYLEVLGKILIPFQKKRYEAGMTYGIPVLFPTPNRTRTCFLLLKEKNIRQLCTE